MVEEIEDDYLQTFQFYNSEQSVYRMNMMPVQTEEDILIS